MKGRWTTWGATLLVCAVSAGAGITSSAISIHHGDRINAAALAEFKLGNCRSLDKGWKAISVIAHAQNATPTPRPPTLDTNPDFKAFYDNVDVQKRARLALELKILGPEPKCHG